MKTNWIALLAAGIAASTAFAAERTWTGADVGNNNLWSNANNWQGNAAPAQGGGDTAVFPNLGAPIAVTVDASATVTTVYFRNPAGVTMTIASECNLHFNNTGALTLRAEEDAVIDGDGTITFSTNSGDNYADNQANPGKTLDIRVKVTGSYGFEHNGTGGTIILANPLNDYPLSTIITAAGWLQVPSLADSGTACSLGTGNELKFNNGEFRYTGNGHSTNRRIFHNSGGERTIEHAGTGTLAFTGQIVGENSARTFILNVVNPAAVIAIAGTYADGGSGNGALGITKRGPGTLRVSGACTHTGPTVVEQGTLEVASGGSLGTATLVRMPGSRLLFSGNASPVGTVQVENGASIIEAASGATVTIGALNYLSGALDFVAAGLGSTTKIFITAQPDGFLGPFATINGGTARVAYDSVNGVHAYDLLSLPFTSLSALGLSTIPNDATKAARILTQGTTGGIGLAAPLTGTAALSQETAFPAAVAFSGRTLATPLVQVAPGGADLTLGAAPGDGTLTAGNTLLLANAGAAAALTVNAAIANNGTAALRLIKEGEGDVVLTGPVEHTGGTEIGAGTLVVSNAADMAWPTNAIAGNGGFTKTGAGTLFLPHVANTYTGVTTIASGTVSILHSDAFGSKAGPTIVKDGAAINFTGTGDNLLQLSGEEIFARGAGPDGNGALRNEGLYSQFNAIRLLTLTGDLTVYPTNRLDVRNAGGNAYVNLNGHGFHKKGGSMFGFTGVALTNDQGTSFIDIEEGSVTLEAGTTFTGGPANAFSVRPGTYLDLYNLSAPAPWSLDMDIGSRVYIRAGNATNLNIWTGPVSLGDAPGDVTFDAGGILADTYTGVVSGPGRLVKRSSSDRAITFLLNPNNTFTGGATITSSMLYAAEPGSLPGWDTGKILALGGGGLALRTTDPTGTLPGFSPADVTHIINDGTTFSGADRWMCFDTRQGDFDYTGHFPNIRLRKFGPDTLTLSGTGLDMGYIRVSDGMLDLPVSRNCGGNNIYIGEGGYAIPATLAKLRVREDAQLTTADNGYNSGQPVLNIGSSVNAAVYLSDTATIRARLLMSEGGMASAVYQTGGTFHNTGGGGNDGVIGQGGHAYYLLADGVFTNAGHTHLGRNASGVGILQQKGGAFTFSGDYQGWFGISRGGTGIAKLESGTFHVNTRLDIGDNAENNSAGGYAEMTISGNAEVTASNASIDMGKRDNMTAILNLNGGTLNATRIYRGTQAGNNARFNFNGGLFRAVWESASTELFNGGSGGPAVTVYERGANIEVPDGVAKDISIPLRPPVGWGVTSIPVATGGAGYIAPPRVVITAQNNGSGSGATAFAHIDHQSGTVTSIEITCPGSGYSTAPTVTLTGGGATTAATLGPIEIGPAPAFGGLTKTGPGMLTLNAANTYIGPTDVRGGTLRLGTADALPPVSALSLNGGALDLGGNTLTNGNITITGGAIVNGTFVTPAPALNKDGPGTLTLSASLARGETQLIPGLWEGLIRTNWSQTLPQPRDSIQLSTRAANGGPQAGNATYANGMWNGNNHMYIYTGYIWNRDETNVTWTFFLRYDDNSNLNIGGMTLFAANNVGNGGADQYVRHVLTPGPHFFEARFGDGGGEVGPGPNGTQRDNALCPGGDRANMAGLLVDYSGSEPTFHGERMDLSNFERLVDPGDGSLFTINTPEPLHGPGLSEYLIPSTAWDATKDGVCHIGRQLTTRAAIGSLELNAIYCDGLWTNNNHTWIYKGILWNRNDEPVTWRWRLLFDDDIMLKIDGNIIAEAHSNNKTVTYASHELTKGPHTFEVRFGDGGGSVGPTDGAGGLTYDPTNSGSTNPDDYILLEDPGDGSLLTTDIASGLSPAFPNGSDPLVVNINDGTLRLEASPTGEVLAGTEVRLAAGTTLDLGGGAHQAPLVTGTGTLANGTLANGSAISPAGDNAIGTMTIDNVTFAQGTTYRLTTDGTVSDCLIFTGPLDMTNLTVVPAPDTTLMTHHTYVIARATAGYSPAALSVKPLTADFPPKYKIVKQGDDILLTSIGGTVLILR